MSSVVVNDGGSVEAGHGGGVRVCPVLRSYRGAKKRYRKQRHWKIESGKGERERAKILLSYPPRSMCHSRGRNQRSAGVQIGGEVSEKMSEASI
jgi:hypothetical protein